MSDNSTPSVRFDGFTHAWELRKGSRAVPALRFKADDGSDFPEWEEKKLGDVGEFIRGLSYDKTLVDDDGQTLVLRSSNILESGSLDYHHDLQFVNKTPASSQVLKKNDVVICMANGSTHLVGKSAQYDGNSSVITTVGAFCSIFRSELVIAGLLFQTREYARAINYLVEGGDGALANLKANSLAKITFHIPTSPEEQQKIASLLSSVDETLYLCQRKLDLLTQVKKALMQQIFSRKLRFTADDGSDFPEWEEKKLGDIADVFGGGTPSTENPEYWDGDVQWFTPTEVGHSKYVSKSVRSISHLGLEKSSAKLLPKGALLLTSRATVGDISIAANECCTNQGFQSLVVKDGIDNEFIYYAQPLIKRYCLQHAAGSTFIEISGKNLAKMPISIPSLPEQQKIAACLSSADALIDQAHAELEQWQEVKKSLLQQMFV